MHHGERQGPLLRNRTEANRQTIPSVDGNNSQGQVNQFLLSKLLAYLLIYLVEHMINGNQGYGLRPCQGRSLTLGIEGSLAPSNQSVNALFSFATRPRSFGMQIDSIGTSIDL